MRVRGSTVLAHHGRIAAATTGLTAGTIRHAHPYVPRWGPAHLVFLGATQELRSSLGCPWFLASHRPLHADFVVPLALARIAGLDEVVAALMAAVGPGVADEDLDTCADFLVEGGYHAEAAHALDPRRDAAAPDPTALAKAPELTRRALRIADAWVAAGETARAEELARATVAACAVGLDVSAAQTLEAQGLLAVILNARGAGEEALELLRTVVSAYEHRNPQDARATLAAQMRLGQLLQANGHGREALDLQTRVLEGLQRLEGPAYPDVIRLRGRLASAYLRARDLDTAERMARGALTAATSTFGPGHPATLVIVHTLGTILRERLDDVGAEAMLRRAAEGYATRRGPHHPSTLVALSTLASVHQFARRFEEARAVYDRVLDAQTSTLGPDHLETLSTRENLATLAYFEGDLPQARKALESLFNHRVRVLRPGHSATRGTLSNLIVVLERLGAEEDAASLREELRVLEE